LIAVWKQLTNVKRCRETPDFIQPASLAMVARAYLSSFAA